MKKVYTRNTLLTGTHYEAGYRLGTQYAAIPQLKSCFTAGYPGFGTEEWEKASALFSRWCPGLNEELQGVADALKTRPQNLVYYAMTWLHPGCSHISLLPSMTKDGRPKVARNYEFNDAFEDFNVIKTSIQGAYTHIGTSVLGLGRDDGFNEMGLAVTMSSTSFPVGVNENMRRPAVTGLQFWAVIRTLLDTCRDVNECLDRLKDMPIAFNMNLILTDKAGNAALYETLDGRKAFRTIGPSSDAQYLYATNHPLLEELIPHEPRAMENSLKRIRNIEAFLEQHGKGLGTEDLKQFLLTPYPAGLSCPYYDDFFGTTKSMVIDPAAGTMELCWGGQETNGWQHYSLDGDFTEGVRTVDLCSQPAPPTLFQLADIE